MKQVFINLAVTDLDRSMGFYARDSVSVIGASIFIEMGDPEPPALLFEVRPFMRN